MADETATGGRLAGKTAIVTGATEGIGRAVSQAFAREGAALVLVARRANPTAALAEELGKAVAIAGDVTDPETADAAVAAAVEGFGRLDVLVNNAGHDLSGVPLFETSPERARAIFEVNVFGAFWMLLAAGRAMADSGGGSIVNVTSRLGLVGMSGSAWYGASKGALHALTRGAAVEWAPMGIRVNSVAPGLTQTAMVDTWIAEQPDPEAFRASRLETIPLGKIATPEEVAAAAVFLASDESASTTGASIAVDGGYTAA
ncbi:MAG TPA: SDR family oxidoreductase [Gaiellales bacterium]|jgi:NAD(P)-dependent dehydrogenase (short-subunit alcohol dehydrogenase family)|nr:SDR family oxidoreductase [Gaiellales bacterium]